MYSLVDGMEKYEKKSLETCEFAWILCVCRFISHLSSRAIVMKSNVWTFEVSFHCGYVNQFIFALFALAWTWIWMAVNVNTWLCVEKTVILFTLFKSVERWKNFNVHVHLDSVCDVRVNVSSIDENGKRKLSVSKYVHFVWIMLRIKIYIVQYEHQSGMIYLYHISMRWVKIRRFFSK